MFFLRSVTNQHLKDRPRCLKWLDNFGPLLTAGAAGAIVHMFEKPGMVRSFETALRLSFSSEEEYPWRNVEEVVLASFPLLTNSHTVSASHSLLGTLRKVLGKYSSQGRHETRILCNRIFSDMRPPASVTPAEYDASVPSAGPCLDGPMGILGSLVFKTYSGECLRPHEVQELINTLSPTSRLRNVYLALASDGRVESWSNQLPVWERFAAQVPDVSFPRMLPGCSSWLCTNVTGCCESALPTRLCSGCRRARYCSEECHQKAWVNGHREICMIR